MTSRGSVSLTTRAPLRQSERGEHLRRCGTSAHLARERRRATTRARCGSVATARRCCGPTAPRRTTSHRSWTTSSSGSRTSYEAPDHRPNLELHRRIARGRWRAPGGDPPRPRARPRRKEALQAARALVDRRAPRRGFSRRGRPGISGRARAPRARRPPRPAPARPARDGCDRLDEGRGARCRGRCSCGGGLPFCAERARWSRRARTRGSFPNARGNALGVERGPPSNASPSFDAAAGAPRHGGGSCDPAGAEGRWRRPTARCGSR